MGEPISNNWSKAPTGALHVTNTMCHFWSAAAPMICFFTQPMPQFSTLTQDHYNNVIANGSNSHSLRSSTQLTHYVGTLPSSLDIFLDALASLAFKLSVTELLSHTFSDMQYLQSVQSLQSQESLQSLQLESIQPMQSIQPMRSIHHCTQ